MLSSHKASNNLWPIRVCTPLIHCRFHRFYGGLLLHRCIVFIVFILIFKTSIIDRRWTLCHSVTAYSRALLPSPGVTALISFWRVCVAALPPSSLYSRRTLLKHSSFCLRQIKIVVKVLSPSSPLYISIFLLRVFEFIKPSVHNHS